MRRSPKLEQGAVVPTTVGSVSRTRDATPWKNLMTSCWDSWSWDGSWVSGFHRPQFTHQVPLEPATVIAFQVPHRDHQLAREHLDGLLPPRLLLSHPPPPCFRAMGRKEPVRPLSGPRLQLMASWLLWSILVGTLLNFNSSFGDHTLGSLFNLKPEL